MMSLRNSAARKRMAGVGAGFVFAGIAAAGIAAPTASAAPDCSPAGLRNTVTSTLGEAQNYLAGRPETNRVVLGALTQPRGEAAGDLRAYFTANPGEYYDLRGILAPIAEQQQVCGNSGLSPELTSAYNEFMAG